ncbi:hypothetical protein KQX54_000108, partial [Cotesia glomerata]
EKTRFDRSVDLFDEFQNLDYRHETPEVFIDYTMAWKLADDRVVNFCNGIPMKLLEEALNQCLRISTWDPFFE